MKIYVKLLCLIGFILFSILSIHADIIINEIMYHPDSDRDEDEYIELFNTGDESVDLSGWSVHGLGRWTVRDGVLTVKNGMGYLSTQYERFDDFILTLKAQTSRKGNSGIFFRSKRPAGFFR